MSVPCVSATYDNEVLDDQLLTQIERVLERTGARKVNLIGHRHGTLTTRSPRQKAT
ncbi:hypothetical protein EMIT0P258_40071 [Pseudomonas sp. IT-P258]